MLNLTFIWSELGSADFKLIKIYITKIQNLLNSLTEIIKSLYDITYK